jgi:hypothetical protein
MITVKIMAGAVSSVPETVPCSTDETVLKEPLAGLRDSNVNHALFCAGFESISGGKLVVRHAEEPELE